MSVDNRGALFGDLGMEAWPAGEAESEPWIHFARARRALAAGDRSAAIALWREIAETSDLETRHYLQAWHFLRASGVEPDPSGATQILGVVLEVAIGAGLDMVVAYADGTARYYNHAGSAVIWDRPDDRLETEVRALLDAGGDVVARIGPWEGERPEAPAEGLVRLNFLTPAGLHFGQAPFEALASDPMAGPVIMAGLRLMEALIEREGPGVSSR